jgi:hypothetical protein
VVSQNNFDSLGKALTAILNHKKILKSVASQRFLKSLGLTQKNSKPVFHRKGNS